MRQTRSLVDMTLKEAVDALAEIAVAARAGRVKRANSPIGGTLGGGILGAGLGGLAGGALGAFGSRDEENPAARKKSRWNSAITGMLAGGALGGGLGLAASSGGLPKPSGINKETGMPSGQFIDPRTGQAMAIDRKAMSGDTSLPERIKKLSEKSPSSRIADAVGTGVGTALNYAPVTSATGVGLLGKEVYDRMNVMRNPRNLAAALNSKDTTKFLGEDQAEALKHFRGVNDTTQRKVLSEAAGPRMHQRVADVAKPGSLGDRWKRLIAAGYGDDILHAAPGGKGLSRANIRELMRLGHEKRMGGMTGFAGRAALPLALSGVADLGVNWARGASQDFLNERELRKMMAQYAKPVE